MASTTPRRPDLASATMRFLRALEDYQRATLRIVQETGGTIKATQRVVQVGQNLAEAGGAYRLPTAGQGQAGGYPGERREPRLPR